MNNEAPESPETPPSPEAPPAEPAFSTITVRVGRLPGRINEIALNGGRTVQHALEGAELDGTGHEIRVNGELSTATADLKDGDTVLLVRKIRGN
jgi:sulfur carrier protein ThiS